MRFVVFGVGLGLANLLSDVHTLGHPTKDGVLVVKPGLSMGGGRVEDRGEGGGRGGEGGVGKRVCVWAATVAHKTLPSPSPTVDPPTALPHSRPAHSPSPQ